MNSLNGFTPGGQLVNDTHIKVAIDSHGQGSRNGRCRHHEHVRRIVVLAPQLRPLRHAKTVLLIDNGEPQLTELHSVFNQRMRSHHNVHLSAQEPFQHLFTPLAFHHTRQQFRAYGHISQEVAYSLQMLLSQYLRRRHDGGLKTVVDGDEHRHQGHERLSRPHIALQQTVHLPSAFHVGANLVHHALLRSSQLEGQMLFIKSIELFSHMRENISLVFTAMVRSIAQNVELYVKKFLELQPQTRPLHLVGIVRIMHMSHGLIARAEVQRTRDKGRKRLGHGRRNLIEQRLHHPFHTPTLQTAILHLLGSHVVRLHAHFREHQFIGFVDVGMRELEPSAIDGGPSEDNVFRAHFITVIDVFLPVEPHQVHHAVPVAEMRHDALLPRAHSKLLITQYAPFDLHKRHVAPQLVDGIDAAAVHIFIRIVFQQVSPCVDIQFLVEDILPTGAHAGQIHDVLVQDAHCFNKASATNRSKGVVILMFSRLPSTICTSQPNASTTEASSVNSGVGCWLSGDGAQAFAKAFFNKAMSNVCGVCTTR